MTDKKYGGLTSRLGRERPETVEVVLTFHEIESVCRVRLPKTAQHPDFWNNPTDSQYFRGVKKAVKAAGFCGNLLAGENKVRFVRTEKVATR